MKTNTTIISFATFIILTLLFISCNKEKLYKEPVNQNKISEEYVLANIPKISNPYSIMDYCVNPKDADDEKISRQLLEIGIAARVLFVDNFYNEIIISEAKNHDNSCISLKKFISSAKALKPGINNSTFNNLEQLIKTMDLTHRSTNPQKIEVIEKYIPAIFVINAEVADYSKMPIISPGIVVNSSLPGMDEFEDYVVAWYNNGEGGFNEILMNENTTMATTHPIFIIDNAEEDITTRTKSKVVYNVPPQLKSTTTYTEYHSREYQINYRYENTGKSEFCITAAQIDENGIVYNILYDGSYVTWKNIANVHKNDIGKLLYHWEQFCSNDVLPFNSNFIFWNTYERDWSKSPKNLGNASRNGKTIYLSGRRRYSNEWYGYDPNQLNNNPVDLSTIYYSWAKWHNNYKGKFRIWRVEL